MEEKRKSKRFATYLKANYSREDKKRELKECTIINISRNGAGLEFYTPDDIDVTTTLS